MILVIRVNEFVINAIVTPYHYLKKSVVVIVEYKLASVLKM